MATYTAATFIPQLQPYQPDLNLYSNLIQNSQSQYDTNWKSLNKVYGQYFYADLTREDNTKKKDYLLNQINFNVGRLAGLDLSLQQNVSQATQVFKPFYEDKGLMKDMAWTKNYNSQVGKAQALQGSADEKRRSQFWDTGLKELQYKREEFKDATADKAMSMENSLYTPYVNVQDKALKLAKDYGNIESVNLSDDGRWVVKKTNGQVLEEPLQKLFEANLGNDPQVEAIYKTQSYVNRKDYANANAAQFGGDKNTAELKYLENNFNILKGQSQKRYNALNERSTVYDNKIKDLQKRIDAGDKSPEIKDQLDAYIENKQINDSVLERSKKENDMMSSGQSSTATTSTGFINPYGDIESLRYKVDNGVASMLMEKDLDQAAHVYAYRNAKVDMDANPYAVMSDKHKYNMSEIAARVQGQKEVAAFKADLQSKIDADKDKIAAGTHYKDETGEVVPYEDQSTTYVMKSAKGTTTDSQKAIDLSRMIVKNQTENHALPWMKSTLGVLQELKNNKEIDQKQLSQILSTAKAPNMSYEEFNKRLQKDPVAFLTRTIGADGLKRIKSNYNNFIKNNSELTTIKNNSKEIIKDNVAFQDYINYLGADTKWRTDSSKAVEMELSRQGMKFSQFLYDEKGNLRSEDQFRKKLLKEGKDPDNADYSDLVTGASEVWKSEKVIKKPIVGIDNFGGGTGTFTEGARGITVNPRSSTGRYHFNSVMKDLRGLDFGDSSNTRISFKGYSQTNWDNVGGGKMKKGQTLLEAIQKDMNSPKSKIGTFELGVSPIATGSMKRGAVVVKPSATWLKQYLSSNKDQNNNLLTNDEYNNILQNGINVMTNSSNMKNDLYQSAFKDPLTSYVDSNGKYEYTDPTNSKYKLRIVPNKLGLGDYSIITSYPIWDAEQGKYQIMTTTENTITAGNNLTSLRDKQIYDFFDIVKETNDDLLNQ
jgi:hypothetical protein